MRVFWFLLAVAGGAAALFVAAFAGDEVPTNSVYLGVITGKRPILLHHSTNRLDVVSFKVKIHKKQHLTNEVLLVVTNSVITEEDLRMVPQGLTFMEVQSVCKDGEVSDPAFFVFELQRTKPRPPVAEAIESVPGPPLPPGVEAWRKSIEPMAAFPALPGGRIKNER